MGAIAIDSSESSIRVAAKQDCSGFAPVESPEYHPSLLFGCTLTPPATPVAWAKHGGTVARVLIVEDEPTDLAVVKGIVELLGHEPHIASDGEEAYRKCLRKDIDVVITDLEMPGVGGLEFIESLLGLYPEAKIIAVSGEGPDGLHAARRAGATMLISKPIGPEELGKALAEAGIESP